jgi:hypothetical protein
MFCSAFSCSFLLGTVCRKHLFYRTSMIWHAYPEALPMECSTTELRQHARYLRGIGPDGRPLGGRFLPQGPRWRKHVGRPERARNRQKSALVAGKVLQSGPTARPNRFPTIRGHQDPKRRIMTLHGLAAPVAGHCGEGRRNPLCSDGSVAGCMGPAWTKAYSADGR